MKEIAYSKTVTDSKSSQVNLQQSIALARSDDRVLALEVACKRWSVMSTVTLGPEREAVRGVLGVDGVVEEDLEELVDGLGGGERRVDVLGSVAVADADGLINVDASEVGGNDGMGSERSELREEKNGVGRLKVLTRWSSCSSCRGCSSRSLSCWRFCKGRAPEEGYC